MLITERFWSKIKNYIPLVAQWIEQRSSKALMRVRFLPRGHFRKINGLAYDGGTTVWGLKTLSGRSVTVARDIWDVLVRVQISAPRQCFQTGMP